jgi:hypothetical protein
MGIFAGRSAFRRFCLPGYRRNEDDGPMPE